jgi:hypothetical protein
MKKILYIILVVFLLEIVWLLLYLSIISLIVRYKLVDVLAFTNVTLSIEAYATLFLFVWIAWVSVGKRWWKLVYGRKKNHIEHQDT